MRSIRLRSSIALIALVFTCALCSAAQEKTGSISGSVTDQDGKPIAGLVLKLEQDVKDARPPKTRIVARVTTDSQGKFIFDNLAPGNYRIGGGSKSNGWIYYDVVVKADEEIKVGELKLVRT
jgi:protocatechuate 3,4-dioxygenase beta subunit